MADGGVWVSILAVLVYSGPFLPLSTTLLVPSAPRDRRIKNLQRLLIFSGVQAVTFAPFVYAIVTHARDAVYALYLPFFTGIPMFLGALVYAASEFGRTHRERRATNDA